MRHPNTAIKVCLISHNASGVFCDSEASHVGGVERQTGIIAEWLAARGYNVSVITWASYEGQDDQLIRNVRVIRVCARDSGFKILRFFWPRWSSLIRALRRADADIYIHNAAEAVTGQIALWVRQNGRKFVCSIASEPACKRTLPTLRSFRERVLYSFALRNADLVVAQTAKQKELLYQEWNRESRIVPMPCSPPNDIERNRHMQEFGTVLWIGRVVEPKRLDMFLEVAAASGADSFVIVGPINESEEYGRNLASIARGLPNVELRGRLAFDEVWDEYSRASVLVCTSVYEGFPNTFLEAMFLGIPIITTFDPDGIISRHELGAAVATVSEIVERISTFRRDRSYYEFVSAKCRSYFDQNHAVERAMTKFESALLSAVQS